MPALAETLHEQHPWVNPFNNIVTGMGSYMVTNDIVWGQWNWTSTSTTTVQLQPDTWYVSTSPLTVSDLQWSHVNTRWMETDEQRRAREVAQQRAISEHRARVMADAERIAEQNRVLEAAEQRARQFLLDHLDAQQKRQLTEHDYFEVISNTGLRWRIRADKGLYANVDLMPDDPEQTIRDVSYCAHSPEHDGTGLLPISDHLLGQKLLLEADQQCFVNVANIHHRRRGVERDIPRRQVA